MCDVPVLKGRIYLNKDQCFYCILAKDLLNVTQMKFVICAEIAEGSMQSTYD